MDWEVGWEEDGKGAPFVRYVTLPWRIETAVLCACVPAYLTSPCDDLLLVTCDGSRVCRLASAFFGQEGGSNYLPTHAR